MSTRMMARRSFITSVVAGADGVCCAFPLPANSQVNRLSGFVTFEGLTLEGPIKVFVNALEGWILPITDPDTGSSFDTVWDQLVPKDTSAVLMDLDVVATDATPFFEPGSTMWEAFFDVGATPQRVYHASRMLSLKDAVFAARDPESTFLLEQIPGNTYPLQLSRRFRVQEPSVLMFGAASPDTLETSNSEGLVAIPEQDWGQIQFIDHVMERAMLSVLGIVEAGAETPWEEAAALLKRTLDPLFFESVAGTLTPMTWRVYGQAVLDFTVEGTMPKQTLQGGR